MVESGQKALHTLYFYTMIKQSLAFSGEEGILSDTGVITYFLLLCCNNNIIMVCRNPGVKVILIQIHAIFAHYSQFFQSPVILKA